MAIKADTSSIFRIVALLTAVFLIAAAVLAYFQSSGGNSQATELAALSQAIPNQASTALDGADGGFNRLDSSLKRLAQLRRTVGPAVPGSSSDWQQLESRAAAIVAKQADVEALTDAAKNIESSVAAILELSNELLDRSGATGIIQEFQQRASRIGQSAANLATNLSAATVAASITDDAAFLRSVSDALSGEDTALDVRPLNDAGREVVLVPLISHLADLQIQVERINGSVSQVGDLQRIQSELDASAAVLGRAFAGSGSGSPLPEVLQIFWIPLGLIALAIVLVVGLVLLNSRTSKFEMTAKVQAAQNERNQQAILRLLDEMGSLADGDLTVEATVTEDITGTIADSFNYAIEELRKLVATVNETAIMVDSAAKQTESTAGHMAKAAENQSREINAATE